MSVLADYTRLTQSRCPVCAKTAPAQVVLENEKVYLRRVCHEHGSFQFLLSENGSYYADFDQYYFTFLKNDQPSGRLTNHWVFITETCQMNCSYCQVELASKHFNAITLEEFVGLLPQLKNAKCTLTGGEPTLHERLFEFLEAAKKHGIAVTLATNGIALASKQFCEELQRSDVKEIRVSLESFNHTQAEAIGAGGYLSEKLRALKNLEELGLPTTLSPTIFRGINEDQVVAACEYAKDKGHIRSLSVNGFSYCLGNQALSAEHMIMPDQMMSTLYRFYSKESIGDAYIFQKLMHTLLHLLGIRLCMYAFLFILVRDKKGLRPLTDYLAMKRLEKGLARWSSFARSGRLVRLLCFLPVLLSAISLKSLVLLPDLFQLLISNLRTISTGAYPKKLLPIVLNTNCSVWNYDVMTGKQCMSSVIFLCDGHLTQTVSSEALMDKEEEKLKSC